MADRHHYVNISVYELTMWQANNFARHKVHAILTNHPRLAAELGHRLLTAYLTSRRRQARGFANVAGDRK